MQKLVDGLSMLHRGGPLADRPGLEVLELPEGVLGARREQSANARVRAYFTEKRGRVGFARIDQRQDVGVLEVGSGPDLLLEALGAEHGRELPAQGSRCDLVVVLHVVGEVDGAHPSLIALGLIR